jgi:hypothetical protein
VRKCAALLALLAACDPRPPDVTLRTGMTPEEINEPPSSHRIKAALLNDVRNGRMLHLRLSEGRKDCPGIVYEENVPLCAADRKPLEYYVLRSDPLDKPYRVDEAAYYCREESVYFYRYVGGPQRLDVWLGPYRLERRWPRLEEEGH